MVSLGPNKEQEPSLWNGRSVPLSRHATPKPDSCARSPNRRRPACLSSAFTTSPSPSTASAPVRGELPTRISVMPAIGCTNPCSPPDRATRRQRGIDDAFVHQTTRGSAPDLGAGKFGHPGWHQDPDWKRMGPNPPFHTPVFVLTHHPRPPIEMEGGTTFHFIDAPPAELAAAREAAGGGDIASGAVRRCSGISLQPGSSTPCMSWWSRSCSAAANASGTDWRARKGLRRRIASSPRARCASDVHAWNGVNGLRRETARSPAGVAKSARREHDQ